MKFKIYKMFLQGTIPLVLMMVYGQLSDKKLYNNSVCIPFLM